MIDNDALALIAYCCSTLAALNFDLRLVAPASPAHWHAVEDDASTTCGYG